MSSAGSIGIALRELCPTQMTVGSREVAIKRRQWKEANEEQQGKLLRRHVVPAVIGPKNRYFIIDHHHFVCALLEEDAPEISVYVVAELNHLEKGEFWTYLDNSAWCHAYNAKGERCSLSNIPKTFAKLDDDPYRSLAAALIREGGYAKSRAPFAEFSWADFMRRRIKPHILTKDFEKALAKAMVIARSPAAKSLPGWAGADAAS